VPLDPAPVHELWNRLLGGQRLSLRLSLASYCMYGDGAHGRGDRPPDAANVAFAPYSLKQRM
jgi:hypothetical protein